MVTNVLPIINLPMALGNLPIAANGLSLVPLGNDIQGPPTVGGGGGGGLWFFGKFLRDCTFFFGGTSLYRGTNMPWL